MFKKIPIMSTIAMLGISTLGMSVPSFAEVNEVYSVSDLVPLHTQYATDMEECGPYNRYDSNFMSCYNMVTDGYRARYGGKFESMYQLDYNGRMVVTGINPTAGTIRLYVDETRAFRKTSFSFQNIVAFWADSTASPSPYWDDEAAWLIADIILNGEEVPQGVHLLYKGVKNEDGWLEPDTEHRTTYVSDGDFIKDNLPRFFFVLGYDTNGEKHIERGDYSGCEGDFSDGSECRLQYTYNGSSVSRGYTKTSPTAEDAMVIELKAAIKEAEEAARIAKEAEVAARDAILAAEEAEAVAREAEANAMEAEAAAREAEIIANEAAAIAREAESAAREAEAAARESEINAREAEIAAREAEAAAREAEANARNAEIIASETATAAREAEAAARIATEEANRIAMEAELAAKEARENATKASEEVARISESTSSKIKELNEKIANLANSITNVAPSVKTYERIVEKIIEKPIDYVEASVDDPAKIINNNNNTEESLSGIKEENTEVPTAFGEEPEFPWWIIAFTFSGIVLVLWWFIPARKK